LAVGVLFYSTPDPATGLIRGHCILFAVVLEAGERKLVFLDPRAGPVEISEDEANSVVGGLI
jgi:hypothetical protein